MCLTGQTGAGKTALIKTIMNCIKRDSGQILYDGLTFYENEIEVKKKVGCIFDVMPFALTPKPKDIVKTISKFYDSYNFDLYNRYMHKFSLDPNIALSKYNDASLKKFYCIVILACNPDLLLLDEPIDFSDSKDAQDILELLTDFMEDSSKSILLATHSPSYYESIADHILLLHNGKLECSIAIEDLLKSYVLVSLPTKVMFDEFQSKLRFISDTSNDYQGLLRRSDLPDNLEFTHQALNRTELMQYIEQTMKGGNVYDEF